MSVIVECSQNHGGSLSTLLTMTDYAAHVGAKYIKIQSFFADDLADKWRIKDFDRLKKLELSWEQQEQFVQHALGLGLIPMTSVYASKYLPILKEIGFAHLKIGSAQCLDEFLLNQTITQGFELTISTGGTDENLIPRLKYHSVLHCVSQYPSHPYESNLSRLWALQSMFKCKVGLSSHINPMHPKWADPLKMAIACDFSPIEVHFTIRERPSTKDGPVSLDLSQLEELCRFDRADHEERLAIFPMSGMFNSPASAAERDLIKEYRERWLK